MPDATGLELIAHDLREQAPGSVTATEHHRGAATLVIDPDAVLAVLRWLRETPNQDYHFLSSVHGCDYLPGSRASECITSSSTWSASSACT